MRPHIILFVGAMPPQNLGEANRTIRRNALTPPPVCSIIIHVDMVFCGKKNGRDSNGWSTIEFAMISTATLHAK